MNPHLDLSSPAAAGQAVAVERNRVLRNTYWLLALSMIPTVLGAWIGVTTGITAPLTGFLGMATLSTVIKRDLGNMGKFLFIGMIMLLVAGIANVFIQSGALMITLSVLAIGIFSAFILYDLKRVRDGEETNYITATLGVYLSLFNIFQSLLALLGIAGGRE